MAVRQMVQIGHPALRAPNAHIVDFSDVQLHSVVDDLAETMRHEGLIGMAAPQLAENLQVFVTEVRPSPFRSVESSDELRVYLNPVIRWHSDESLELYEGCGSVMQASLFGPVKRPKTVTIEAFDLSGKHFSLTADGILGRVIQHEFDHLQGVLFTDQLIEPKKLLSQDFYLKLIKEDRALQKLAEVTIKEFYYLGRL